MLNYKKIKSEFTKKLAKFDETKLLSWVKFDETKQERMCSEEEVCELIQFLSMNEMFNGYSSVSKETANYFLQQFKNKLNGKYKI